MRQKIITKLIEPSEVMTHRNERELKLSLQDQTRMHLAYLLTSSEPQSVHVFIAN